MQNLQNRTQFSIGKIRKMENQPEDPAQILTTVDNKMQKSTFEKKNAANIAS